MSKSITNGLSINVESTGHAVPDARRSHKARDLRAPVPRRRTDGRRVDGAGRGLAARGVEAPRRAEAGRPGARSPGGPPDALQRAVVGAGAADRLDQPDGRILAEAVR